MLLLLIVPIWTLLLLVVAGLCAGARLGDAVQQSPEPLGAPLACGGSSARPRSGADGTRVEIAA
jgi:hypothetical protein